MNYSEFFQKFYFSRSSGGLIGYKTQKKIPEFFFKYGLDEDYWDTLPTSDSSYEKYFKSGRNPKNDIWDALNNHFSRDDLLKNLLRELSESRLRELMSRFDIGLRIAEVPDKRQFANAIVAQFQALAAGNGLADNIVPAEYKKTPEPVGFETYLRGAKSKFEWMKLPGEREYLLLPYLESIFKGKADEEAFLRYLSYGYGEVTFLLLDRSKLDKYIKQKENVKNFKFVPTGNTPQNIVMGLVQDVLNVPNSFIIGTFDKTANPEEATHFIAGVYENDRDEEEWKKGPKWIKGLQFEIKYLRDSQYLEDFGFTPYPIIDEKGRVMIFGYVYKGDPISLIDAPDYKKYCQLKEDNTIVNNTFTKDYPFSSASAAAAIILGRSANGKTEWEDEEGIPLKNYIEKQ